MFESRVGIPLGLCLLGGFPFSIYFAFLADSQVVAIATPGAFLHFSFSVLPFIGASWGSSRGFVTFNFLWDLGSGLDLASMVALDLISSFSCFVCVYHAINHLPSRLDSIRP